MASEGPQPQADVEADQKQSLMGTPPSAGANVAPPVLSGAGPGPDCVPGDSPFAATTRPDTAAAAAPEPHQHQEQGQGSGDPGGAPIERDSLLCTPLGGSNMSNPFGGSSQYERMLSYENYGGDLPFSPIMRQQLPVLHQQQQQNQQQQQQQQEQPQQKQEQQQQRDPPRSTEEGQSMVKREASETPGGDGGLASRDVCLEANTQDTQDTGTKDTQAASVAAARAGAAEPPAGPSLGAAAPLRTAVVTTGAYLPTASTPAPNTAQVQSTFTAATANPVGVPVTTGGPTAPPQQRPAAAATAAASTPAASTAAAVDNQSLLVGLFRTLAAARDHVAAYGSLPPPLAGTAAGTGVPGVGTPSDWGADVAACWRPQVVADTTPPPQQQVRQAAHRLAVVCKTVCGQCHSAHVLHPQAPILGLPLDPLRPGQSADHAPPPTHMATCTSPVIPARPCPACRHPPASTPAPKPAPPRCSSSTCASGCSRCTSGAPQARPWPGWT